MERIKDLSKVVLRGDGVLGEVIENTSKSGLILPDSAKSGFDYLRVLTVGNNVNDISTGDIIMDLVGDAKLFLIEDKKYALVYRGNITLAVTADNFDFTKKIDKFKSKIIS